MKEICQFIINDNIYTIYDVDKIEGKDNYVGRSHYEDKTIYVEKRNRRTNATYFETRTYARLAL